MRHTKPLGFFAVYEPVAILDTDEGKAFIAKMPEGLEPHIELIRAKLIPATDDSPERWVQDKLSPAIEMVKHCTDGPAFWHDDPDVEVEGYKRRFEMHYQYGVKHRIGGPDDWAHWDLKASRQHWHYGAPVSPMERHKRIRDQLKPLLEQAVADGVATPEEETALAEILAQEALEQGLAE